MSDHSFQPAFPGQPGQPPVAEPREKVLLGLLAATGAVVLGIVVTVVVWRLGFIASITSFLIAVGAVWLYAAVGGRPRKGLLPLVGLVVLGVVLSFFGVVASDLWEAYDELQVSQAGVSRSSFITENIFNGELLKGYGKDMAMFGVFALLGIFSTLRRLLSNG